MSQRDARNNFYVEGNVIKYPCCKNVDERGVGWYLFEKLRHFKDRIAQIDGLTGETETNEVFLRKCIRTAIEMRKRGVTSNDNITICSHNHMDTYVPEIASFFLGARVANTDPNISLDDTAHLLSMIKPKMFFVSVNAVDLIEKVLTKTGYKAEIVVFGKSKVHTEFSEFLKESAEEEKNFVPTKMNVNDTGAILFSSGTTGLSKGICLSHKTLEVSLFLMELDENKESDVNLTFSSPYWISALLSLIDCISRGVPRLILPQFEPEQIWDVIKKFKVFFLLLTPTQLTTVLKNGRPKDADTSSLKYFGVGGSALSKEQIEMTRKIFPTTFVLYAYGQTELGARGFGFEFSDAYEMELHRIKPTSCGRPSPGFEYKIVDIETEEVLGPNQHGELRIKSDFCMNCYLNIDSRNAWDSEGFLKTGDIAYYDDEYCFYIVDRIKEMLKFQGWQITPSKLEGILLAHPQVQSALVIGIPHPEDGDHPMGIVVLRPGTKGITAKDIEKYVEDRIDDKQRLRAGVKIVDKIPSTPSDKLMRKQVRDLVLSGKLHARSIS